MELSRIDQHRTELLQFLLWLLLCLLALISFVAYQQRLGNTVLALTVVSLLACLYAVGRERQLKKRQTELRQELSAEQTKSADLKERLSELAGLYRAISAVNSATRPELTFDVVVRAALDLVDGNRGSLMLLDEGDEYLKIVSARGLSEDVIRVTHQAIGEGVAGWVAAQLEPLLLSGRAKDDERFVNVIEHAEQVRQSICVPLHLGETVLGVINVGIVGDEPGEGFGDYHLRLATIFAQHASVAIENARLRLMHSMVLSVEE